MAGFVVDGKSVETGADCYVVAEVGHNHQGNPETAMEMFRAAREAGADAVKLQKRHNATLYTRDLFNRPYDHENSFGPTYGSHREALEFGEEEYRDLQQYALDIGITMFATAFDPHSADFLADLDMPAYKTASGDLKNIPLLRHVARLGKPMFISTGGGSVEDVERAYDAVAPINSEICIMQCTAAYPVEPADMNLRVISTFKEIFPEAVIGLSDHQSGIAMALAGFVLGAQVIEKHFTLNRAMRGTDHAFSLEPAGLKKLVRDLRRTRVALGDGVKRALPCEDMPMFKMSKKLVAARNIKAGAIIRHEDVAVKSPGDGLPPYRLDAIVGLVALRDLEMDETITFEDLSDNLHEYGRQYGHWSIA